MVLSTQDMFADIKYKVKDIFFCCLGVVSCVHVSIPDLSLSAQPTAFYQFTHYMFCDFDGWSFINGETKLGYTGDEEATISEFFGYYNYKLLDLFIK